MSTSTPPTRPPALLARVADGLAVAAGVLAVFVLVFGGFVVYGPVPLRVHGVGRILFIAAAIVAIRHAAYPVDPLHRRLARWFGARDAASPIPIVRSALVSRVAVLLIGFFAVVTIGLDQAAIGSELSPDPVFNLPARFDAGWYSGIALDGYSFQGRWDRQQNIAFFPAFPLLMRVAGYPVGAFAPGVPREHRMLRADWAGVLISLAAFAWAAAYLWRLARDTIGESRADATVLLLAAYPFAAFYSAPYTESLFLLGAVAAIYHFRRSEWGQAATWGLLVGLTRPNGCFLSLVLALLLLPDLRAGFEAVRRRRVIAGLTAASAPGVGMLIYSAYVHHVTGAFFGWARLHEAWGRSYEGLAPVARAYGWLTDEGLLHVVQGVPFDTLNSLGLIFVLVMLWPVVRKVGLAYGVFVAINIIPPMLAGGVLSMGRLTATMFPVFLALAAIVPARAVPALVTTFAIGQGLVAALFFTWRPLF